MIPNSTTKYYSMALGLILLLAISGTLLKNYRSESALIIPELLDRNERITMGKEWDQVQSQYVNLRDQLQKNANDHKSLTALAHLFIREARVTGEHGHYYPAALLLLNHVLTGNPADKDSHFNALATKAGVQLSLHDFEKALATAREAVAINPFNAQIYGVLVDCHVELGQYREAVALADKMVSIRPDLRSYSRVSYLREIFGDVSGAKEAMMMAIHAGYPGQEETAWAMHTYAEMLMRYGQDDEAATVYESLLQERPDYPFAVAGLGKIAIKKGDLSKGEVLLKDAIDIIPEVDFYVTLAELYKNQNKMAACEKLKAEILVMLQDDTEAGHHMDLEYAHVYHDLFDDTNTAIAYATKELKKRPLNIDVNRTLALLELEKNQTGKAKLYYEAATSTQSRHPELEIIKTKI